MQPLLVVLAPDPDTAPWPLPGVSSMPRAATAPGSLDTETPQSPCCPIPRMLRACRETGSLGQTGAQRAAAGNRRHTRLVVIWSSLPCSYNSSSGRGQPRQWNMSVGQPQHEVRLGHVSNFCASSWGIWGVLVATPWGRVRNHADVGGDGDAPETPVGIGGGKPGHTRGSRRVDFGRDIQAVVELGQSPAPESLHPVELHPVDSNLLDLAIYLNVVGENPQISQSRESAIICPMYKNNT